MQLERAGNPVAIPVHADKMKLRETGNDAPVRAHVLDAIQREALVEAIGNQFRARAGYARV